MKAIYLPAGRKVWINVANYLKDNNVDVRIWLGDPVLDEAAKGIYPNCNIESFFQVNKGELGEKNLKCAPGKDVLTSPKFYILKDKVYKIMDRQDDERKFGRLEREAVFYSIFNYYYDMVINEEVEILIASEAPHATAGIILYGICEILNIPTYHLMTAGVAPLAHVCKDFYGDTIEVKRESSDEVKLFSQVLTDYIHSFSSTPEEPEYMKNQKNYDGKKTKFAIIRYLELLGKGFRYSKKSRLKTTYTINQTFFKSNNNRSVFSKIRTNAIHSKLEKAYYDNISSVSFDGDYVFYPLHYEPEKTSTPDGGHYYQVYDAVSALRHFVPSHIPIYVKEHYSQFTRMLPGYRGKSPYLYDALKSLPNVHLIEPTLESSKLVRNALLTVSQTGTACLEAACYEKKSILMGDTWFSGTPNVYCFNNLSSFDDLMASDIKSREEIAKSMMTWLEKKAIVGCVNPSMEGYFLKKFPDDRYATMFDDELMAKRFIDTILADVSQHNRCNRA